MKLNICSIRPRFGDMCIFQQVLNNLVLVLTLMITSKGIAGVPGVSFVVLLATLGSVDMARTVLNVIGNALAVLVISKWEGCGIIIVARPSFEVTPEIASGEPFGFNGKVFSRSFCTTFTMCNSDW
ncbi:unnamed protein product [Oppiella nova]|uniref:Amino acid transporter n=1 Tax=Oppiella nova TaxID=334625 RepID=A0A7R9L9L7_9ACAR|nr:unnamed protein product [Oppiella nova]CAG2157987.1 unnamed protein product [Oppiella nova]